MIISLFISTILFLEYLWFAVHKPSEVPGDVQRLPPCCQFQSVRRSEISILTAPTPTGVRGACNRCPVFIG